jgi:hypothetical protein
MMTTRERSFILDPMGYGKYNLEAKWSLGTVMGNGLVFRRPICVSIEVLSQKESQQIIHFSTKMRKDFYFLFVFFAFMIICTLGAKGLSFHLLIPLLLAPVCIAWFRFIYRMQEEEIVAGVVRPLKLVRMKDDAKSGIG